MIFTITLFIMLGLILYGLSEIYFKLKGLILVLTNFNTKIDMLLKQSSALFRQVSDINSRVSMCIGSDIEEIRKLLEDMKKEGEVSNHGGQT